MKLSRQQRDDVIAEVLARMETLGADLALTQRACLYYGAFTALAIAKRGVRAILQAGSASWPFKAVELDDGLGPTHYSYQFDPMHPLSAQRLAEGAFPEMHCWAAIPGAGEIVDLTTQHLPALFRQALPNETWSAASPPPYFWGKADALRERWHYVADRNAIDVAFILLRRGSPEIFAEVNIPGASSGAFDRTQRHPLPAFSDSRGCERERVVPRPLAHARSHTNQAEASFGVSDPSRMKRRRLTPPEG